LAQNVLNSVLDFDIVSPACRRQGFKISKIMVEPILYNVFCCWAVFIAALIASLNIFKHLKRDREAISFAWFWLLTALMWFLIGGRNLVFYFVGHTPLDRPWFLFTHILVIFPLTPIAYYISWKVFASQKLSKWSAILFFVLGFVYLFFMLKDGVRGPNVSIWGTKYALSYRTFFVFLVMYISVYALGIYDLISRIIYWIKNRSLQNSYKFFTTLSIFIYGAGAYLDEKGTNVSWQLLLVRSFMMTAALMVYIIYTSEEILSSVKQKNNKTR